MTQQKKACQSCLTRPVWDTNAYLCWSCENTSGAGAIFTGREE